MQSFSICLFSQSKQFLDVTKKSLELSKLNVEKCISDLDKIEKVNNKRNKIFIVQIIHQDKYKVDTIIDFFYKNELSWICISQYSDINFLAMSKGAMDNIILKQKPTNTEYNIFIKTLVTKIKYNLENLLNTFGHLVKDDERQNKFNKIIAIGASTGGAEAVQSVIFDLDKNTPPILVVIHMPPGFTKIYADNLNNSCKMYVKEAKDGDILRRGVVYIAPGGYHMRVVKNKGSMNISCKKESKVNGHMPSVNVLFESIAENIAPNVIAVILTGMGDDGALGILKIKDKGGFTIGQDKKTSIVYGMPNAAKREGGILIEAPLKRIPSIIMDNI